MPVEFLTVADNRLAYQRQVGAKNKPGMVFLGGFASDMTGTKAGFLSQFCAERGLAYVRFDYRGCGQSLGEFTDGTIGMWLEDTLAVIDRLTEGPQIIVGSSMGGWMGLLAARERPGQVKGLIGVAAAPDFTEDLVWEKLTVPQREKLWREGEIYEDEDSCAPLTLKLIEEARSHLVLRSPFAISCPIRLLQGAEDAEVPASYAQRIADHVTGPDTRVTLIKNGDHRLSRPEDLALLGRTVADFL